MSHDDGSEHDRRLVEVLNRYGLRATFHLNSSKLDTAHHVARSEVRSLYQGHEVACHAVHHSDLTTLSNEAIDQEIADDKKILEDLFGEPIRGIAYPFGRYDDRVLIRVAALGLAYGRTAQSSGRFALPEAYLTLCPSCHHNQALALGRQFLEEESEQPLLLYVWGHSFEFDGFMSADPAKDWGYLDAFCRLVSGHPDVYYATTIELMDYVKAARGLAR